MSTLTTVCYPGLPTTTKFPTLAVVFSITFHLALIVALSPPHIPRVKAPVVKDPPSDIFQVDLTEPPEPIDTVNQLDDPPPSPSDLAPSLPDVPAVNVALTDFTQEMVVMPPNTHAPANLITIPANPGHGPGTISGNIFNPADLEKRPEAISRTSPTFPYELQSTVSEATVVVGFIITSRGEVVEAHIISSSHPGFERSALSAIGKWKFRPGMKNGQKVNTRVEQPLSFVLTNDR